MDLGAEQPRKKPMMSTPGNKNEKQKVNRT